MDRGLGRIVVRERQNEVKLGKGGASGRSDVDGRSVIAAIDIGSNSIKMTVARGRPGGGLDEVAWRSETVRLGAGLDQTGRLAADRIEAALATLGRFATEARSHGASRVLAVATEATRAAANGEVFLDRVRRETGIDARLIDGDEEADLTFRGLAATVDLAGEVVVADIGGASTEIIAAGDGAIRSARSLTLGSGRLTDRFVTADPPTRGELSACRGAAAEIFVAGAPTATSPAGAAVRLIVVGGTGEYLGRLVPDELAINPDDVETVLRRLEQVSAAALAAELSIAEARARVLPAGVAIVAALADQLRPNRIVVARSGIRTGLLLAAFAEENAKESQMNGWAP
jgi:exopolyphosphatase/guanosine-5'-triphosphate,3'-diphosphate pyrophosphatase